MNDCGGVTGFVPRDDFSYYVDVVDKSLHVRCSDRDLLSLKVWFPFYFPTPVKLIRHTDKGEEII